MSRLIFVLILFLPATASAADHYLVRFEENLNAVTVEACFDGAPPRHLYRHEKAGLFTDWIRSGGIPLGDGSLERRLRLPKLPDDACVQWRVDLSAAVAKNDRRLVLRLNETIVSSADLWFWRDDELRVLQVEVELPAGNSISTPWKEAGENGGLVFLPERTPASWSSRIAVGPFPVQRLTVPETVKQDSMEPQAGAGKRDSIVRLAIVGENLHPAQREVLAEWIRETAECVASTYGRFPQDQPQILVIASGKQREAVPWAHVMRGGGVAAEFFVDESRSISEFRDDWTATHELSHMLLPYVSGRDRWLSEGLASYYQNVLRARDGRLTEKQAWQKLHGGFERGKRATRGGSLANATRSGRAATMRVYWSGAAIMLKADTRLRELSGGRQSVDTALSGLQQCCTSQPRSWRARELFAELDRISGYTVFMDLYREHVIDEGFPDLSFTYGQLGIVPQSGSILLVPDAPLAQIRYQIMNDELQRIPRYPFPASTPHPQQGATLR